MYVCICRQITDNQIREECMQGTSRIADLREKLGLASECGKCCKHAKSIVNEFQNSTPFVNAIAG